jgi:hypothetical protein
MTSAPDECCEVDGPDPQEADVVVVCRVVLGMEVDFQNILYLHRFPCSFNSFSRYVGMYIYMYGALWRCGIVVIAPTYRTEDPEFESRQGVIF